MSAKEIRALVRCLFEEYNKGKAAMMALMDEMYATNFVLHSTGKDINGLKNAKQYESEVFSAFPDMHITIDDIFVEGDKAAVRWTFTGTHKGKRWGLPPTNKKIKMWAISINRFAGGKFVEEWTRYDTLGLMQQLGLAPTPGKGK
jgi:predicted ester cyclase